MSVTAVSRHLFAVCCVTLACAVASPLFAQPASDPVPVVLGGTLSKQIVEAETLTPAQVEEIRAYVTDSLDRMSSPENEQSRIGRDRLLEPLTNPLASTAFRLKYSEILEQPLSKLVSGSDDRLSVNALRIAGMCASARTVSILTTALSDKRPSVRYGSAMALGEMLRIADRGSGVLNEQRLSESMERLGNAIASDASLVVAEGAILALDAPRTDNALRARAAEQIASGLARRLDAFRANAPAPEQASAAADLVVRGVDSLRVLLIDPSASATLSPEFVKQAAVTAGKAVAYAAKRLDTAPADGLTEDESTKLAAGVGAADFLMIIAMGALQPGAPSIQTSLQTSFTQAVQGAGSFKAAADTWIGAKGRLVAPPVSAKSSEFAL